MSKYFKIMLWRCADVGKVPKYFWLRLKKDFFKRHDIRYIESLESGHELSLFYLKMLCESVDHNGCLRFSEALPYNAKLLGGIFNVSEELAQIALDELKALNLIDILEDGTIVMLEIDSMIGSETYWAVQKREKRGTDEGQRLDEVGQELDTVGQCLENVQQSKSKSIEIDIYKPLSKDKGVDYVNPQEVVDLFCNICQSYPAVRSLSEARKKAIKARSATYTLEDFKTLFTKAEASSFLKGANDRDWRATFDWLIKDTNMAKVLDGNYDDRPKKGKGQQANNAFNNFPQNDYDFDELEKKLMSN